MIWKIEYSNHVGFVEASAQTTTARRPDKKSDGTTQMPWTCNATGPDEATAKTNIRLKIKDMERNVIPNYSAPTPAPVARTIAAESDLDGGKL